MVMSRGTAVGSIVTGSVMLCFAIAAVIGGAITFTMSGDVAATAGLWSLYYGVPGILSIMAGVSKNGIVMGFALFFNIIAMIVSAVASVTVIIYTIALNGYPSHRSSCKTQHDKQCKCSYTDGPGVYDTDIWNFKCSDFDTVYIIMIAMLVVYIILCITTFIASIVGCLGTCCAPIDPIVVVTTGVPANTGGTVVVGSYQSSVHGFMPPAMSAAMPPTMPPTMPPAMPPTHGYPQPPAYCEFNDCDKAGLVRNIAF